MLVRIPTKEKGQCLTIWCRVIEEELQPGTTRYLVLFSPMYMARSLLPNPMEVVLSVPGTKDPPVMVNLPGREVPVQLETLGPSDQKYHVAFKVVDDLPPSEPVSMSWGIIEQVRGKEEAKMTIDEVVRAVPGYGTWEQQEDRRWPFLDSEEDDPLPRNMVWATNAQPQTDVQVTMVLERRPKRCLSKSTVLALT